MLPIGNSSSAPENPLDKPTSSARPGSQNSRNQSSQNIPPKYLFEPIFPNELRDVVFGFLDSESLGKLRRTSKNALDAVPVQLALRDKLIDFLRTRQKTAENSMNSRLEFIEMPLINQKNPDEKQTGISSTKSNVRKLIGRLTPLKISTESRREEIFVKEMEAEGKFLEKINSVSRFLDAKHVTEILDEILPDAGTDASINTTQENSLLFRNLDNLLILGAVVNGHTDAKAAALIREIDRRMASPSRKFNNFSQGTTTTFFIKNEMLFFHRRTAAP